MKKSYDVIVLGANGFLGAEVVKFFKTKKYKVLSVTSKNYRSLRGSNSKIIINTNGNTYRFKANKNPQWDFKKSFLSVCDSVNDFEYNLYIYISSVDVYHKKNDKKKNKENSQIKPLKLDFYAFHKWMAERYVEKNTKNYLIFRLGTLIGPNMKKGPLLDLIKNNYIFMNLNSKLTIISKFTALNLIYKILKLKIKNEIFNITGSGSFSLHSLKNHFKNIKSLDTRKHSYDININKINKHSKVPTSNSEVVNFFRNLKKRN